MREIKVKMPISVELGKKKKKKYYLNLNIMRNQVGHLINNVKREYKRIAAGCIPQGWFFENYSLHYTLYLPDRRKRDISNVLSICDKNFTDSLVELGYVPEDNYFFLREVTYKLGGYDENFMGYVDIVIKEEKYEEVQ